VRWESVGEGPPIVLVHGTPYSSFLWRDVAPALARSGRRVYVFDHLGYGQSDARDDQDLTLAAQGRRGATLQNFFVSGTCSVPA
jgi:pimeloyl-ACP methyl ester carboxylesterase